MNGSGRARISSSRIESGFESLGGIMGKGWFLHSTAVNEIRETL